jgi:4-amino-4-deoxy-L-arabinose transferase-like glycosyltransferase
MGVGKTALTDRMPSVGVARSRQLPPPWSGQAWWAIAITTTFIATTCWWLTQDRSVPIGDAGSHLQVALTYRNFLDAGDLLRPLHTPSAYPPFVHLVGAVSALAGGVNVAAPIIGENLFFVVLMALGCYHTGRLAYGPRAGLLAVIFVLGSPLLIEQFHVFMLDAPEAAMVALTVWLILASERFSRTDISALAGLAAGLGLSSKEHFPLFIVGLLAVVLLRERGWRHWRGILVFAAFTFAAGAPWYIVNLHEVGTILSPRGIFTSIAFPGTNPPTLSLTNLQWYGWAILNTLLFAPLFAFAAIGTAWATFALVRRGTVAGSLTPELLGGLATGWLAITITPLHQTRYTMPMLIYLAVLGTGWITTLPRVPRQAATGTLALAVLATTLGASFGLGGRWSIRLPGTPPPVLGTGAALPYRIVVYSNRDLIVSGPRRDGDVLAVFKALRSNHIAGISWSLAQAPQNDPVIDSLGISVFAMIAQLPADPTIPLPRLPSNWAFIIHQRSLDSAPPCVRLSDGSGVWLRLGNPLAPKGRDYCPLPTPRFYGP